jgi:hypothetical protein
VAQAIGVSRRNRWPHKHHTRNLAEGKRTLSADALAQLSRKLEK